MWRIILLRRWIDRSGDLRSRLLLRRCLHQGCVCLYLLLRCGFDCPDKMCAGVVLHKCFVADHLRLYLLLCPWIYLPNPMHPWLSVHHSIITSCMCFGQLVSNGDDGGEPLSFGILLRQSVIQGTVHIH